MPRLYLVRHGETEWNRFGNRYCGRSDVPLSATGRTQALRVQQALATVPFAAIYSSPLQRARDTAEAIAGTHALPITFAPELSEIDYGSWEGKMAAAIDAEDAARWASWQRNPEATAAGGTGETADQVVARATRFLDRVGADHGDDTILVVAHNTLNRLMIASTLGMPLANYRRIVQRNAAVSIVDLGADGARWLVVNDTSHLGGEA